MADTEFYEALMNANKILLQNYHDKKRISIDEQLYNLYICSTNMPM